MENDPTSTDLPRNGEPSTSGPAETEASPPRRNEQSPAVKRAQAQTKKKFEFVSSLLNSLDMIIYLELCIVYYMDCSFFRLLLRVLNQMMFLTPKPAFIPAAPQHRPYIGAIFGPNIICILLHIFTARSEAGEAMRGYLHGGVIIDLIGQKGPTSKIHLVLLDILVLVLQCLMLAVHVEKERLQAILSALVQGRTANTAQPRAEVVTSQDHDAEERGVVRDDVTNSDDIELQALPSQRPTVATEPPDEERNEEHERLLAEPRPTQADDDDDSLDMFWSGMAIVTDFHILHNLRRQWNDYGSATGSALQTVGFNAEFASVVTRRRLNAATARFQRGVESLSV